MSLAAGTVLDLDPAGTVDAAAEAGYDAAGLWFDPATLADAVAVVTEVDRPNGAVLVDTLHLARSGGCPDDLRRVPARLLPYLQVADAPTEPPGREREALRDEALHGRLLPGEGALPLGAALAAVPDVPLSLELRSTALMARFPDPTERARAVRSACGRLLGETARRA